MSKNITSRIASWGMGVRYGGTAQDAGATRVKPSLSENTKVEQTKHAQNRKSRSKPDDWRSSWFWARRSHPSPAEGRFRIAPKLHGPELASAKMARKCPVEFVPKFVLAVGENRRRIGDGWASPYDQRQIPHLFVPPLLFSNPKQFCTVL